MSEQLVSIIMPSYNAEKYLRRSINSVIAQTYSNWELLIVDDGSTDSSKAICEEYCAHDHRIKLICNQHGGTALARNTALDIARGEYFAFLDADDVYHPMYIKSLIDAVCKNNCNMAICRTVRGTDSEEYCQIEMHPEYLLYTTEEILAFMYNGKWSDMIAPYTKLSHRSVFDSIRFPNGKYFEDASTMNLAIYRCNKICMTDAALYFYNITPNSSSVTKKSYELLDREWALRSHWEFFFTEGRNDLAYMAIPFYLSELIVIYHRIQKSDKPEDCLIIRKRFNMIYKRYIHKLSLTDTQRDQYFAFRYPRLFDIRNMVRRDGVMRTAMGFIKRKLG